MEFIFFLAFIFIVLVLGFSLSFNSILINKYSSIHLIFSTSYFVGSIFIIVFLKTYFFLFQNLFFSNILLIFTIFFFIFLKKNQLIKFCEQNKFFLNIKIVLFNLLLLFLIGALLFSVWIDNKYYIPEYLNNLGSLHSGKYVWLSNYIYFCNNIPVLGQNTGQSILTYFSGFVTGSHRPYLFLYLWLVLSSYFLMVYFFSFLKIYFSFDNKFSFLGSFFLMFGGTALSITHVLIVDSGNPIILNGYTDTLFGIFSIVLIYNIFIHIKEKQKLFLFDLFLITIVLGANYFMSPQNIIFIIGCLFFIILDFSIKIKIKIKFLAIFIFSLIFFIPQGGMLTPTSLQNELRAPEIMNLSRSNIKIYEKDVESNNLNSTSSIIKNKNSGINIYPGYPFFFDGIHKWNSGQILLIKEALSLMENLNKKLYSFIWTLEKIFINSIVVLFFPILGLILIISHYKKISKNKNIFNDNTNRIKFLAIITLLAFLFGSFFTFFFSINGYKWELSRFIIPFVTFGLLCCFIVLRQQKSLKLLLFIIFFSTLGPISSQVIKSANNIANLQIDNINLLFKDYKNFNKICNNLNK